MANQRTWVIQTEMGPDGFPLPEADRQAMHALFADLEATLFRVGGLIRIVADREKYGRAGEEDLYRTVGYVVQWQQYAPARPVEPEQVLDPA